MVTRRWISPRAFDGGHSRPIYESTHGCHLSERCELCELCELCEIARLRARYRRTGPVSRKRACSLCDISPCAQRLGSTTLAAHAAQHSATQRSGVHNSRRANASRSREAPSSWDDRIGDRRWSVVLVSVLVLVQVEGRKRREKGEEEAAGIVY